MQGKTHHTSPSRIKLTDSLLKKLFKNIYRGKISELSLDRGLSYTLVYNLVHGRIGSLSARDFKILFGEDPPLQETGRVDGDYFRGMAKLWVYLNSDVTEADLHREFYPQKKRKSVDYRIFSGEVKTVAFRLEKAMEKRFFDQGFSRQEIKQYIKEYELTGYNNRIYYDDVKPMLDYLEKHLRVHPGRILNQFATRYESGELVTVPKTVYDLALRLKKKAGNILESGSKYEIEKLREEIYGKRTGLTLFSEVEDELDFLKIHGGRSPKHYLGRSISPYKKSKLKRIAGWRAQKIKFDCYNLITENPEIPISSIPKSFSDMILSKLVYALTNRIISMLFVDRSRQYERSVLIPTFRHNKEYSRESQKTIGMDEAAYVLGMSKNAFDLMVASHRDIFRSIVVYEQKWLIPDAYLNEILGKDRFSFIKAKYEYLAKDGRRALRSIEKVGPGGRDSNKTLSQQYVSKRHRTGPKRTKQSRSSDSTSLKERSSIARQDFSRPIDSSMPDRKHDLPHTTSFSL